MLIEARYFVPDALGEAAQVAADRMGKVQFIGLFRRALAPTREMWSDFKSGNRCLWTYGPTREELQDEGAAIVLWIPPLRECRESEKKGGDSA